MMKKLMLIMILVFSFSGCSGKYDGWKEIELQDYGSIKVPEGWTCHIKDETIYFTDEGVYELTEDKVHMTGFIDDDWEGTKEAYKMFDENAKHINTDIRKIYSNDTYIGIKKYTIYETQYEKAYLRLGLSERDKEIEMLVWGDSVSYDDLEKIAKSFDRNLPEEIEKEKRK